MARTKTQSAKTRLRNELRHVLNIKKNAHYTAEQLGVRAKIYIIDGPGKRQTLWEHLSEPAQLWLNQLTYNLEWPEPEAVTARHARFVCPPPFQRVRRMKPNGKGNLPAARGKTGKEARRRTRAPARKRAKR